MKVIDEIMSLARRYAPTLIAHLVLFVWLSLFVIDGTRLPDTASIWKALSSNIDLILKAVGLSIERWYVIVGLLLAYVTVFEWLRNVVRSIPLLRLSYRIPRDPDLLGWACDVFRLEPDPGKIERTLRRQVDRAIEQARQSNRRPPYQHLEDQRAFMSGWYGTMLILLLGVLTWALYGASYARAPGKVWLTVAMLAGGASGLRWYIERLNIRWSKGMHAWVVSQHDQEMGDKDPDPLRFARRNALTRRLREESSLIQTPAFLIFGALNRLPRRWSEPLKQRISFPDRSDGQEWPLAAASQARQGDPAAPPPAALAPEPFLKTFGSLLERRGTGLAVLAPRRLGLAVAADDSATYAFDKRRHEGGLFGVSLVGEGLDDEHQPPRLEVVSGWFKGFITCIGEHPIERLIAGGFPFEPGKDWFSLSHGTTDGGQWLGAGSMDVATVDGIEVARRAPLRFGASYLIGVRTGSGAKAHAVVQAFRVQESQKVLIAWCILDVDLPEVAQSPALPWWRPAAWRGLIREAPP